MKWKNINKMTLHVESCSFFTKTATRLWRLRSNYKIIQYAPD